MGSKKLVYSCIVGILLGFLVPFVLKTDRYTTLMIGMGAGLGIGYLLDIRDSKKDGSANQAVLNKKADRANKLLERAKRGLEDETLRMGEEEDAFDESAEEDETETGEDTDITETEPDEDAEEQAEKLKKAEELLREAREKMNR